MVNNVQVVVDGVQYSCQLATTKTTEWTMQRSLEVGLVVLVILLVILGLIVGFGKMREVKDGHR
jgi:uncharacterized membrane protein YukC